MKRLCLLVLFVLAGCDDSRLEVKCESTGTMLRCHFTNVSTLPATGCAMVSIVDSDDHHVYDPPEVCSGHMGPASSADVDTVLPEIATTGCPPSAKCRVDGKIKSYEVEHSNEWVTWALIGLCATLLLVLYKRKKSGESTP